jgi:hypothetical protein
VIDARALHPDAVRQILRKRAEAAGFWAADWTPLPAIATRQRRWPALSFTVQPSY